MREEIEKRLIELALAINELSKYLEKSYFSKHMTEQMIRSSTSAALNFAEAQGAESRKDYQHKTGVVLKELRETKTGLLLIQGSLTNKQSLNPYALTKLLLQGLGLDVQGKSSCEKMQCSNIGQHIFVQ